MIPFNIHKWYYINRIEIKNLSHNCTLSYQLFTFTNILLLISLFILVCFCLYALIYGLTGSSHRINVFTLLHYLNRYYCYNLIFLTKLYCSRTSCFWTKIRLQWISSDIMLFLYFEWLSWDNLQLMILKIYKAL